MPPSSIWSIAKNTFASEKRDQGFFLSLSLSLSHSLHPLYSPSHIQSQRDRSTLQPWISLVKGVTGLPDYFFNPSGFYWYHLCSRTPPKSLQVPLMLSFCHNKKEPGQRPTLPKKSEVDWRAIKCQYILPDNLPIELKVMWLWWSNGHLLFLQSEF